MLLSNLRAVETSEQNSNTEQRLKIAIPQRKMNQQTSSNNSGSNTGPTTPLQIENQSNLYSIINLVSQNPIFNSSSGGLAVDLISRQTSECEGTSSKKLYKNEFENYFTKNVIRQSLLVKFIEQKFKMAKVDSQVITLIKKYIGLIDEAIFDKNNLQLLVAAQDDQFDDQGQNFLFEAQQTNGNGNQIIFSSQEMKHNFQAYENFQNSEIASVKSKDFDLLSLKTCLKGDEYFWINEYSQKCQENLNLKWKLQTRDQRQEKIDSSQSSEDQKASSKMVAEENYQRNQQINQNQKLKLKVISLGNEILLLNNKIEAQKRQLLEEKHQNEKLINQIEIEQYQYKEQTANLTSALQQTQIEQTIAKRAYDEVTSQGKIQKENRQIADKTWEIQMMKLNNEIIELKGHREISDNRVYLYENEIQELKKNLEMFQSDRNQSNENYEQLYNKFLEKERLYNELNQRFFQKDSEVREEKNKFAEKLNEYSKQQTSLEENLVVQLQLKEEKINELENACQNWHQKNQNLQESVRNLQENISYLNQNLGDQINQMQIMYSNFEQDKNEWKIILVEQENNFNLKMEQVSKAFQCKSRDADHQQQKNQKLIEQIEELNRLNEFSSTHSKELRNIIKDYESQLKSNSMCLNKQVQDKTSKLETQKTELKLFINDQQYQISQLRENLKNTQFELENHNKKSSDAINSMKVQYERQIDTLLNQKQQLSERVNYLAKQMKDQHQDQIFNTDNERQGLKQLQDNLGKQFYYRAPNSGKQSQKNNSNSSSPKTNLFKQLENSQTKFRKSHMRYFSGNENNNFLSQENECSNNANNANNINNNNNNNAHKIESMLIKNSISYTQSGHEQPGLDELLNSDSIGKHRVKSFLINQDREQKNIPKNIMLPLLKLSENYGQLRQEIFATPRDFRSDEFNTDGQQLIIEKSSPSSVTRSYLFQNDNSNNFASQRGKVSQTNSISSPIDDIIQCQIRQLKQLNNHNQHNSLLKGIQTPLASERSSKEKFSIFEQGDHSQSDKKQPIDTSVAASLSILEKKVFELKKQSNSIHQINK